MERSMMQNSENSRREAHPDSMEALVRFAFDAAHLVAAVLAAPFELMLRRKVGSRYLHILILALAPFPPLIVLTLSLTAGAVWHSTAPLGMGIVYVLVQVFLWLHYIHVFHMIAKPQKEELSREDGKAFPFWKLLPYGDKWAMVRFIYEPGMLILISVSLFVLNIATPIVAVFLGFGAFALIVRSAFIYYYAWEYLRDILDQFNLTYKLAGGSNTSGSQEAMQRAIDEAMARRPRHLPQGVLQSVQKIAKTALPDELQGLIDEAV